MEDLEDMSSCQTRISQLLLSVLSLFELWDEHFVLFELGVLRSFSRAASPLLMERHARMRRDGGFVARSCWAAENPRPVFAPVIMIV